MSRDSGVGPGGRRRAEPDGGVARQLTAGQLVAGRLRPVHRPALRARQDPQGPGRVPRLRSSPALAAPTAGADLGRTGQLRPAPVDHNRPRRVGRGEQRRAGSCATAWTVCWWCRTVPAGRSWTGCGGRRRERRVRGWCGRWTGLRAHIHTRRPPRRASPTLIRNTGKPGIPVCWRMWLSGRSSIPRNVIETGISPGSRYVLASPLVHPDPHRAQ